MQQEFDFSDAGSGRKSFSRLSDFFAEAPKQAAPSRPAESGADQPPSGTDRETGRSDRDARKPADRPMTVSQLNDMIRSILQQYAPARFSVAGEVSNCRRHRSGHVYLTLKDEGAAVSAVIWRSVASRLKFGLEDGQAVVARGRLDYYSEQGKLQVVIEKIEPAGVGALQLAYRQLAEKLQKEGLFDPRHKQPLPRYPQVIAIVTSDTGAAVRDIHQTLSRRYPAARQLLYPVRVQGEGAAAEVAAAIADINRRNHRIGPVDVMIVGRGGGSIEDLWAFNEEVVARAIFASRIPVISAVGHEIDTTIADLVADVRAATPTAAAELAVPDRGDLTRQLAEQAARMRAVLGNRLEQARRWLAGIEQRGMFARPLERIYQYGQGVDQREARLAGAAHSRVNQSRQVLERAMAAIRQIEPYRRVGQLRGELGQGQMRLGAALNRCVKVHGERVGQYENRLARQDPVHRLRGARQQLDQLARRLAQRTGHALELHRRELDGLARRLDSLDPKAVLKRGYSITRRAADGAIVRAADDMKAGERLLTELAGGRMIESEVTQTGH